MHYLGKLLPVHLGVHDRFSVQHDVLLRVNLELVVKRVMPKRFHGIPTRDVAVLDRVAPPVGGTMLECFVAKEGLCSALP